MIRVRHMAKQPVIKFTANVERNLEEIERFLTGAEAPQAYDSLLDELLETVIPNLERFPGMGRPFMLRQPRSVETTNALARLGAKLLALTTDPQALREYVLKDYLLFYAQIGGAIYLLGVRHHKQLSFDLESRWTFSGTKNNT
jgi:plasmid stabilization system protein ParE